MIYTCIADGIRSPPAFFLKNKYKEPMKMQNENTNAHGCMREFPVMMAKHFAASVSVQRKHSRTTAKLSAPALTKDMVGCCAPATVK